MVPTSLSQWFQRYGRAGHDGQPSVAILLVEPSVFKKVKARVKAERKEKDDATADLDPEEVELTESFEEMVLPSNVADGEMCDDADDGRVYQKKVEDGLREWIEATGCRRAVADKYFGNPARSKGGWAALQCLRDELTRFSKSSLYRVATSAYAQRMRATNSPMSKKPRCWLSIGEFKLANRQRWRQNLSSPSLLNQMTRMSWRSNLVCDKRSATNTFKPRCVAGARTAGIVTMGLASGVQSPCSRTKTSTNLLVRHG